jgi:hypothetical protein
LAERDARELPFNQLAVDIMGFDVAMLESAAAGMTESQLRDLLRQLAARTQNYIQTNAAEGMAVEPDQVNPIDLRTLITPAWRDDLLVDVRARELFDGSFDENGERVSDGFLQRYGSPHNRGNPMSAQVLLAMIANGYAWERQYSNTVIMAVELYDKRWGQIYQVLTGRSCDSGQLIPGNIVNHFLNLHALNPPAAFAFMQFYKKITGPTSNELVGCFAAPGMVGRPDIYNLKCVVKFFREGGGRPTAETGEPPPTTCPLPTHYLARTQVVLAFLCVFPSAAGQRAAGGGGLTELTTAVTCALHLRSRGITTTRGCSSFMVYVVT